MTTSSAVCFGSTRSGSVPTDKLFTGQRRDIATPGTGLYYHGARYYDPVIGRFISPDSIVQSFANPQTLNRYSYVLNNPLKYIDPTGHWVQGFDDIKDLEAAIALGLYSGSDLTAVENFVADYNTDANFAKYGEARLKDKDAGGNAINWVHIGSGFFAMQGTKEGANLGFNVGGVRGSDRHPSLPTPEQAQRGAVEAGGIILVIAGGVLVVQAGVVVASGPLSLFMLEEAVKAAAVGLGVSAEGLYFVTDSESLRCRIETYLDTLKTIWGP